MDTVEHPRTISPDKIRAMDAAIQAMQDKESDPAYRQGLSGYTAAHGHAPRLPPCKCMLARAKERGIELPPTKLPGGYVPWMPTPDELARLLRTHT